MQLMNVDCLNNSFDATSEPCFIHSLHTSIAPDNACFDDAAENLDLPEILNFFSY